MGNSSIDQNVNLLGKLVITSLAGVDGFVKLAEGGVFKAGGAFFGGGIYWFKEDFKSKFFILLYHLR